MMTQSPQFLRIEATFAICLCVHHVSKQTPKKAHTTLIMIIWRNAMILYNKHLYCPSLRILYKTSFIDLFISLKKTRTMAEPHSKKKIEELTTAFDSLKTAKICAIAADDKKASDILILDIAKLTSFADYFVICSAPSERQVQAIVRNVE